MSVIIKHTAGFFSCCSVKLDKIIEYINNNQTLPTTVDSSALFSMYKTPRYTVEFYQSSISMFKSYPIYKQIDQYDITFYFFKPSNNSEYTYTNKINYSVNDQFKIYRDMNLDPIMPFIKKYFEPSQRIKNVANNIINKYNILPEKCIALYYRGTDKSSETMIDSFESFHNKLDELLISINNKNIQILIQTDSAQFLDYINSKNTNHNYNLIFVKELTPSYTNIGRHLENTNKQNYIDITNLLSIVLIISKCKYIICSSGNVSIWMMYYRGNTTNVYQSLNLMWV